MEVYTGTKQGRN